LTSFRELGLSNPILKAIDELGFETPSEIQQQSIPMLAQGKPDFVGLAQTGTGKTAAFGLPLLERIDPSQKHTQALVLAPTRELGQQIAEQLNIFSKYMDRVNVLAVYGGTAITNQIQALRRPQHVVIATPGRLLDLLKRKAIKLDQLEIVVLDEADEMLNMGFKEDLDEILSHSPADKMTWLFSATMPAEISRIVKTYMHDPLEVKLNSKIVGNENIEHQYIVVRQSDKYDALTRFLDLNPDMRGVVFCRTKRDTQRLAEELLKNNYKADALHGDLSQAQRDRVMKRFKNHELKVLIATDVAARGIDVNDLTHVFHFTLPDDTSYYTHRSGRTARAGKKGISLSFINGREKSKIDRLARDLKTDFEAVKVPNTADIADIRIEKWCQSVLETRTKGQLEDELLDKVNMMFGNLSKEELTAKLVKGELDKLNLADAKDLNMSIDTRPQRSSGGGGGSYRSSKPRYGNSGGSSSSVGGGGRSSYGNSGKRKTFKKKKY
jgi:ATP-dependent RNA helicase DeaD